MGDPIDEKETTETTALDDYKKDWFNISYIFISTIAVCSLILSFLLVSDIRDLKMATLKQQVTIDHHESYIKQRIIEKEYNKQLTLKAQAAEVTAKYKIARANREIELKNVEAEKMKLEQKIKLAKAEVELAKFQALKKMKP